jgi:hypothetical protein
MEPHWIEFARLKLQQRVHADISGGDRCAPLETLLRARWAAWLARLPGPLAAELRGVQRELVMSVSRKNYTTLDMRLVPHELAAADIEFVRTLVHWLRTSARLILHLNRALEDGLAVGDAVRRAGARANAEEVQLTGDIERELAKRGL